MRYSAKSPHYSIAIHEDAEKDLDQLFEVDEDAAADILTFLDEAKLNQVTLDNFTRNNYVSYDEWSYEVKEWQEAKKGKLNLWRLRLLWLTGPSAKCRVIYAFNPLEMRYYVLGIVNRDFDYDFENPITKRIISAYENLGLPRI